MCVRLLLGINGMFCMMLLYGMVKLKAAHGFFDEHPIEIVFACGNGQKRECISSMLFNLCQINAQEMFPVRQ